MKKSIFVLSVLTSLIVVGCATPNTDIPTETSGTTTQSTPTTQQTPVATPAQPETPATQPQTPVQQPQTQTPVEDKSPYEYVKPACVNLTDYTYVGDYIFADTMNFAEWKYSNSETEYRLAFEKIARVKNDNSATRIVRCNHNDPDTEIPVIKATKYKIYVKTSVVNNTNAGDNCFSNYSDNINGNYDGSVFRIKKISDNTFEIKCRYENSSEVLNNYVVY